MPRSDVIKQMVEALCACELVLDCAVVLTDIDRMLEETGLPPRLSALAALDAASEALTAYEYEQAAESALRRKAAD
jgi:hypothetical protein